MTLTVEIPTHTLADGRLFIRDEDARRFEYVREFVERFPNYWQRDTNLQGWVSPPPARHDHQ